MKSHDDLFALGLLLAVSVAGPVAAVRLRIPAAVVLILLGMGLGPVGLSALEETPSVTFLSELGFLLLMFMAGMEIDFEAIRTAGRSALVVPSIVVVGIFACAGAAAAIFHLGSIELLVISAISVGMPLAVLKETEKDATPLGRHVMLTASIGEFVCILAITGLEVVSSHGFGLPMLGKVGKVTLLFVLSAVLIRWARAFVWWYPKPFRRLTEHRDVAEMGVRVGLLIMLGFVALSAVAGVEPILGAFIGGSLVGFVLRHKHALESKIAALGNGFFIPIFFVVVGLRFEASALDRTAVKTALLLSGLAALSRLIPSLAVAQRGTSVRDRFAAGALLSAPLTLVVAIGSIGKKLSLIDAREQASIVLVATILSIVFPVVFRLLVRRPAATMAGQ